VVERPGTRYARTPDGLHVAYQVFGSGDVDLVCAGYGNPVSIDMRDDEPHFRRFERRLASFSRFIRFDPRGLGLSDPLPAPTAVAVGDGADEVIAVLDAVGSPCAALFAVGGSSMTALVAAAAHPTRVSSLILVHGHARLSRDVGYPCGIPQRRLDEFLEGVLDVSGETDGSLDDLTLLAPSLSDDPEFRAWWTRASQRSASPRSARAMLTTMFEGDVRAALPAISAPTLVLHRTGSLFPVGLSQFLADHIAGARLVELPGRDHFPYAGDGDAIADEVEEFLTGARSRAGTERVLTTVLFTDIVASTQRAAEVGDRRWRDLLDRHDAMVREELQRFRGREVKTTGDGVLATFDGPALAMRCAASICAGARRLGVEVRAGLHTGEVEVRGDDVTGIAVNLAQRVSALAAPGEVLVSRTVVDLVAGSGTDFEDRGEHELKGISGAWRLFAVKGLPR
jgi:class 3 adenylate cyclase